MRSSAFRFVAVAAIGGMLAGGCASRRSDGETPRSWHASGFHPTAPDRSIDGYEAAFRHIARSEGLPDDMGTLMTLAADSTLERSHSHLTGELVVVRAECYGRSRFGIRGAQGQGRYYAFQIGDGEWKLVGIFHGNSYRWDAAGDTLRVMTRWHMSASESPETIYTWTGQLFE